MRSIVLALGLAAILAGCVASRPVAAVDIAEVIAETQKTSASSGTTDVVWWIPTEFWRASLASDPSVTEQLLQQFETTLSPYVMFVIAHGRIGAFGGVTWTPAAELLPTVDLRSDHSDQVHHPLDPTLLSPDARNLADSLRPVLANMLGAMGQNMHFVFFPARDGAGRLVADPHSPGQASLRMMGHRYAWRLPLGSLLPKKHCPVDGEPLNGAWQFCPWHGKKLESR